MEERLGNRGRRSRGDGGCLGSGVRTSRGTNESAGVLPKSKRARRMKKEAEPSRGLNRANKRFIQKVHNNLGRPAKPEFCKALRMARARPEVWKHVKDEFQCSVCNSRSQSKLARSRNFPYIFEAGLIEAMDGFFFPDLDPRKMCPVLNVTNWGMGYQYLE